MLISISLGFSALSNGDNDGHQQWVKNKTVYLYRTWDFHEEDKQDLVALEKEIESKLQISVNDPTLWFLKGRAHRIMLSLWIDETRKSEENIEEKKKEYSELISRFQSEYIKALELDGYKNSQQNLDAYMLTTISNDVLATVESKIMALKRQIRLEEKPDDVSDSYAYDLYNKLTVIYMTEARYDDALALMDEMLVTLPGWKDKIEQNRSLIEEKLKGTE